MHDLVWGFQNNWQNDDKRIPFYPLIWEKIEKTMTHWPSNQFIFQNFSLSIANSFGSWVLQNTRLLHFMWNISIIALYLHNKTHFIIFVPNFLLRVLEHSAWRQMKKNYQIYLPYQFHRGPQSVDREPQFPNKKMKTIFLWNMSKSRRLTSTFFPIITD